MLDAAHTVPAYWYGKNKAASLFGTGPVFGANANQMLAWIHYGGGKELYRELIQDILGLNLVGFFSLPMPTQPLGWFKERDHLEADDVKGLKYRTVGLATDIMQGMGAARDPVAGRRNRAGAGARRDRGLRVQQPDLGHALRRAGRGQGLHAGSFHQAAEFFEIIFNKDKFDGLDARPAGDPEIRRRGGAPANFGLAMNQYSNDLQKLINKDGVNVYRTPN